jgi:hypothetical protein
MGWQPDRAWGPAALLCAAAVAAAFSPALLDPAKEFVSYCDDY